ncbi:MAG: DegT/DnrJ/EryC1/StrS family aminotransferase [Treponema sp.]|jgi:dTDP-4-amino-4,6-dideoxygalactose transaminase|nr:DegT/DnrJ/EryC1/StrS family aminotransferase [Treponema sp.]
MIQTFSSTIRRKEMDAVLTCMVDEKIGPGELNQRLIQTVKEFFSCDGAVALRSPETALKYAFRALDFPHENKVMISALSPSWYLSALEDLRYEPLILDVDESTGLVSPAIVEQGIKDGGRLLLLHETMGILPDMAGIQALGIPVIEDVSQSAGAVAGESSDNPGQAADGQKKAGLFGVYSFMGLEEHDIITGGGGAVLLSPGRREWIVLKKFTDSCPETDLLPDINSSLAWVQLKEFKRNEAVRRELYSIFQRSLLAGRHKTYIRDPENGAAAWSFPVVLTGNFNDVKKYAARKDIAVSLAYEKSVAAVLGENLPEPVKTARSLLLRCVLFPLYPRLSHASAVKISKVLGTLP